VTDQAQALTLVRIREYLTLYYSPLPQGIEVDVQKYLELLGLWGKKINLTGIHEREEIVKIHFGESIFAFSAGMRQEGRLADLGTGSGFPGLALKLAAPNLLVTLVEPNKKKCAFLHEIVRKLGLRDVKIAPSKFENADIPEGSLDAITCRALGLNEQLLGWSKRTLAQKGELFLWLGGHDCERASQILGWKWERPKLIPETRERYILKGKPE